MSVSNVSGSSSGLFEFLQALQQNQNQPANTGAAATTGTDTDAQGAQAASSHHHHHHGGGGSGSSLISKIEGAVTTALQSATPGSDPNKTIQDAIAKALGSGDSTTGSDPTSATTATTTQPDQSAFLQLLQTYGVTQQQFQQDIQSALEQAQQNGGPLDFSKIFGSFPPGTNVDTTA